MDGQRTDRWIDGQVNRGRQKNRTDGRTDRWTDGQVDRHSQMDRDGQTGGHIDRRIERQVNRDRKTG